MENIDTEQTLFVERYRPQRIEDCILPTGVQNAMQGFVDKGTIPNILAHGSAGSGKSAAAVALCKQLGYDWIMINGSDEGRFLETLRNRIRAFASSVSFGGNRKCVILDECLEEHEMVRIGTVDDWIAVALKDLEWGVEYPVVSFNMETRELENDTGTLISEKMDDVYEVTLDDGRTVEMNSKHPLLVEDENGAVVQKQLGELTPGSTIISFLDESNTATISHITFAGQKKVRNLTVHSNHTFVTENGIPTHNCDYMPADTVQPALRAFIEEYANNCSFILTCNFPNRVIDPLHSRCTGVNFTIPASERSGIQARVFRRCLEIMDNEGIEYDKATVAELVKIHFPDFRRVINEIQRHGISGKIDSSCLVNHGEAEIDSLIEMLRDRDFGEIRKWVATNPTLDMGVLVRNLYDRIYEYSKDESIPSIVITMADYQYKHTFAIDAEVNIMAMLTQLMMEVEFK